MAQSLTVPVVKAVPGKTAVVKLTFRKGGGTTNIDFFMNYDETLIDEDKATVNCTNTVPEFDSFNCTIDKAGNRIRGIGINLAGSVLSTKLLASINLPVLSGTNGSTKFSPITGNFADANGKTKPFGISWKLEVSGPPAKPAGIQASDGTFSDKVRVTFTLVPGATVYRIFRCLSAGQTCGSPVGFSKTGTFDDTRGIPDKVYYYRVRACNPTTCGLFSSANTGFSSNAPAKPTGIRATDGSFSDKVRVTFNTVAGATVYRVFRCLTTGPSCGSPIGFPKMGVFNDTKGVPGKIYYYRVRACNTTTCSLFSAANIGFSSTSLTKPTGVKATDGTLKGLVRVRFNTVAGATVYRVFRCLTVGQTCGSPIGFPKSGIFDDKKGVSGQVYYYRVSACNATTCSQLSAANAGHRGTKATTEADNAVINEEVSIPVLSGYLGRWLLILMTLGFGLLLIKRGYIHPRK